MFDASQYSSMYERFLGPLARGITVKLKSGSNYVAYQMTGHVTRYQESDLISGGSIQLGDLRLIVMSEDLQAFGIEKLGLKDRVDIDGRTYSIVHFDEYSRSVGGTSIAVEMTVRGGGLATVASRFVVRITGSGDTRITGNGDRRVVKEAI